MIKIATLDNLDVIVKYNILLAKETEYLDLNEETVREGVKNVLTDSSKGTYYIYVIDDVVIGQVLITYEWSDWRNSNFWWIQSVYVHKNNRNQKVFKNLFNYIFNLAKDLNSCGIRLYADKNNTIAINTYINLGLQLSHYNLLETYF
ncbi:MAG: GNAT family N-acetyltransferase [Bacilli bacterium]|nr:GNAT family N-acetyltransferase [Bacilli bacterium]